MPSDQITRLFVLAVPVACITWTITHEEIFREPREWCERRSHSSRSLLARKFFYLFTCEYCFSHYVSLAVVLVTDFRLGYEGWRGFGVALFALVWIANVYMSLYSRLRLDIKHENVEIAVAQQDAQPPEAKKRDPA
ncbi:MAG: hypothetical protein ABJE47_16570 [bacterium]